MPISHQDYSDLPGDIQAMSTDTEDYVNLSREDDSGANQLMTAIKSGDLEHIATILATMSQLTNHQEKINIFCQNIHYQKDGFHPLRDIKSALELACEVPCYQAVPLLLNFMENNLNEAQQLIILTQMNEYRRAIRSIFTDDVTYYNYYDKGMMERLYSSTDRETDRVMNLILKAIFNLTRSDVDTIDTQSNLFHPFRGKQKLSPDSALYKQMTISLKLLEQCLEPKYSNLSKVIYQIMRSIHYRDKTFTHGEYNKPYILSWPPGNAFNIRDNYHQLLSILIPKAGELSEQEQADFLDEGTLIKALEQRANRIIILQIVRMMKCCKTSHEKTKQFNMLAKETEGGNTLKQIWDNRDGYKEAILPMLALIAQLTPARQQHLLLASSRLAVLAKSPIISQQEILHLIKENPEQNARYLLDLARLEVPNKGTWLYELLLLAAQRDPNSITPMLETIPKEKDKYHFFLQTAGNLLAKLSGASPEGLREMIEHFITDHAIKHLDDYLQQYPNKEKLDFKTREAHFNRYLKPLIDKFNAIPRETFSKEDLNEARAELRKIKKAVSLSTEYQTCATELLDLLNIYHDYTTPISTPEDEEKSIAPQPDYSRLGPVVPGSIPFAVSYAEASLYGAPSAPPFPSEESFAEAVLVAHVVKEEKEEKVEAHDTTPSAPLLQGNNIPVARQVTNHEDDVEPPPSHAHPEAQVRGRSTNPKANT